ASARLARTALAPPSMPMGWSWANGPSSNPPKLADKKDRSLAPARDSAISLWPRVVGRVNDSSRLPRPNGTQTRRQGSEVSSCDGWRRRSIEHFAEGQTLRPVFLSQGRYVGCTREAIGFSESLKKFEAR